MSDIAGAYPAGQYRATGTANWRLCFDALGGKQDDLPLEGIEHMPILKQMQDYHFVLHWLHEHMPREVMAALVARVNPEWPEMLWKKYGAKFAGDVQNKRVLYGLQAIA